jgi:hypothetical protein
MNSNTIDQPRLWKAVVLSIAILTAAEVGQAIASVTTVNPAATYLRTNGEAVADAVPIDLTALGIDPGDTIRLERLGDWEAGAGFNFDEWTMLIGVFSASNVLLSSDQLNRVQDALDAGDDVFTGPTQNGGLATDIAEDFQISGFPDDDPLISFVILQVPPLAEYLFIVAPDTLYADNFDPDGDFALQIDIVPEPSTLTSLSVGAIAVLGWSRTGRRGRRRG